jgi:hypothetical protein
MVCREPNDRERPCKRGGGKLNKHGWPVPGTESEVEMMFTTSDKEVLRDLAGQVAEIAALPVQEERRELWKEHNSLRSTRPMILIFPEGSWRELLPDEVLKCEDEGARRMEWTLRSKVYQHEHFQDDSVIEDEWVVQKVIHDSGWGLEGRRIPSPEARGSWKFDPVLKDPSDLDKLRCPEITYDKEATESKLVETRELLGDSLNVKLTGVAHISYHLMAQYTRLRGLKPMMIDMYRNQEMLDDAMSFLVESHRRILEQYVKQNLLSLNNDGTYHNSGGNGYRSGAALRHVGQRGITGDGTGRPPAARGVRPEVRETSPGAFRVERLRLLRGPHPQA